jgi:hypothetical protein
MAWRSSTIDVGAWLLVLGGFGALMAGVTLAFGAPVGLMVGGVLLLWAGLRAARRTT